MNYLKINGTVFDADIAISKYRLEYNVLDGDNAGRSQDHGSMIRDIIGAFPKLQITVFRKGNNYHGLDVLWEFLKAHSCDDYITLEAADGQNTISGKYYYSSFARDLENVINGINYYGEIEINFVAMNAEITP